MNYSGIDLHSNNSMVNVIDETDHVVAEKRLHNDVTRILAFLGLWQAGLAGVVVEYVQLVPVRRWAAGREWQRMPRYNLRTGTSTPCRQRA
ncbi:hypothetical protein [Burkholderia sp. Ac-20353]|uniref:hypothetical protein n=1 Tax=Burkholderia sp. Ac-20353 TaxID=2703894 RepID=UPI001F11BC27|nr:hypothetical protein [Burkholderia sp. Ac-20353]